MVFLANRKLKNRAIDRFILFFGKKRYFSAWRRDIFTYFTYPQNHKNQKVRIIIMYIIGLHNIYYDNLFRFKKVDFHSKKTLFEHILT